MSLVERAIQKLQENRAAVSAPTPLIPPAPAPPDSSNPVAVEVAPVIAEGASARAPEITPAATAETPESLLQAVEPTITIETEVIRISSRPIWHVDLVALRDAGVLPSVAQERLIAEQYRRIKRPLIANLSQRGENLIEKARCVMLTSALPGDGKTYTSINLAFSLAREKDTNCLLIDADVAKPHISEIFGLQNERGLLDALTDESIDVESLVLPTDVPGLHLLPAGRPIEGATELLASERMQVILERLDRASDKRICLFDSPPLLLSSESRVIVNLMGQIVLVVRAGVTPKQAVFDAIGNMDESKYVGVILNQSETAPSSGYYGYGYGYGAYGNPPPAGK